MAQENHTLSDFCSIVSRTEASSPWRCWGMLHLICLPTSERSPTWQPQGGSKEWFHHWQ
jgi:hypothetical protein